MSATHSCKLPPICYRTTHFTSTIWHTAGNHNSWKDSLHGSLLFKLLIILKVLFPNYEPEIGGMHNGSRLSSPHPGYSLDGLTQYKVTELRFPQGTFRGLLIEMPEGWHCGQSKLCIATCVACQRVGIAAKVSHVCCMLETYFYTERKLPLIKPTLWFV